MSQQSAIIIGAGPAGLTAAYELLASSDIHPVIYEASGHIGGISKTIEHHGNRIDLGGHRFFSKSDRIMDWWLNIIPLQGAPSRDDIILKRSLPWSDLPDAPDPEKTDLVMLLRQRRSRIFYLGKFFDYPVALNLNTICGLGLARMVRIGVSYIGSRLQPIRPEKSLEDFFSNRFGRELYLTFFKDYTEKVWGVPCRDISAEWGAQRVKGVSVSRALMHALRKTFTRKGTLAQKSTETSLIERFLYPKLGPGQMWETVAEHIRRRGGEIHLQHPVRGLFCKQDQIVGVQVEDQKNGEWFTRTGEYFFSTMAVKDLVASLDAPVPQDVRQVAQGLQYRNFITVGLLLPRLKISNQTRIPTVNNIVPDCWIYIQESGVQVGRLQIFNNWSPYLVHDPNRVWIGLEYFCNEDDGLWNQKDADLVQLACAEVARIGIIDRNQVLDSVVIRMPKTYPVYFGAYDRFDLVRRYTDHFRNLFLIGRNGMHRYNNMDHSMLTAMTAVDNIRQGIASKENIWAVNTEEAYLEEKSK